MSDESPQLETPRAQPPKLSESTIAEYRRMLVDKDFEARFPQQYSALRASVDAALQATGYQPPPPDSRTPEQILFDKQRGVTFDAEGKVPLPSYLAAAIKRDTGTAPDPVRVARQLAAAGLDPDAAVADAKLAIERAGHGVKPEELSAHALAQLALWGRHLRNHANTRPR